MNRTVLFSILKVVVNAILQAFGAAAFLYASVTSWTDCLTFLSQTYDVRVAADLGTGSAYMSPRSMNDLYYYQATTGNRWNEKVKSNGDTLELGSVLPEGFYVVIESSLKKEYYMLEYEFVKEKGMGKVKYTLVPLTNRPIDIRNYFLYHIVKSFVFFLGLSAGLIALNFLCFRNRKQYFYWSSAVSIAVSFYINFIFIYGEFYKYLLF